MTERHAKVAEILLKIEAEMRRISLWSEQKPSASRLQSSLPFCYDALTVEQWLQWILLPRMRHIIEQDLDLPERSDIYPYAEEFLSNNREDTIQLLALIKAFDELFA
jgi:uncharacterized protein YqcC (DUF446 family)